MSMLKTDWVKIAQSGDTVDDRVIEAQWLYDIAETYDPKTYTAVINVDHYEFYGNQGTVNAVKTSKKGEVVELWAELKPGFRLLKLNNDGQKLFFSIEPKLNFANTGKAYLTGLACTDQPASLGTSQLQLFSKNSNLNAENYYFTNCQVPNFSAELPAQSGTQATEQAALNAVQKFFAQIFKASSTEPEPDTTPDTGDNDTMNENQFKEFMEGMTGAMTGAIENGFTKLEGKFSEGSGTGTDDAGQNGGDDNGGSDASANDGNDQFAEVKEGLANLTEQFGKVIEKLEQPKKFTKTPEATGTEKQTADVL